jgi:hypothetical protein
VPPVTRAGSWALAFTGAVTWWRPNAAEPDHGARVSDLLRGDELVFLDVPVSSPG